MIPSMTRYITLMLLLALFALPVAIHAAQTCRSQSEIPASTPSGQFVDHGDGTVTDAKTGLMWAKCTAGLSGSDCASGGATAYTWQEALDLASASNLAGYSDWRLPNINELRSIVEEQCHSPAINLSVFPNTSTSYFWSASPYANYSDYAWGVDFSNGNSNGYYRYDVLHVRLVRGGQSVFALGDLAVSVSSEHALFRLGKNNDFEVVINNLGDQIITDAEVTITHGAGFDPSWVSGWQCVGTFQPFSACKKLSHKTDADGTSTVRFRVALGKGNTAQIKGDGEFSDSVTGVTVTASVTGGTPADPNLSNNEDEVILTAFPPTDLPGTQNVELCDKNEICNEALVVDENKPTVILTHGLQSEDNCDRNKVWTHFRSTPPGGAHLLDEFFTSGEVNVLQYHWKGACHGGAAPTADSYIKGRQNVYHAGKKLAAKLKTLLAPGGSYGQKIQFIGHSLGTAVNAYASKIFLEEVSGIPEAQVTILDYPNRVSKIFTMSDDDERLYGFDRDFFAEVLPFNSMGEKLKVDNYYAKKSGLFDTKFSDAGVGTEIRATKAVFNREIEQPHRIGDLFLIDEATLNLFSNDHSGIHQWYRWTMRPNEEEHFQVPPVCTGSDWNNLPNIPFKSIGSVINLVPIGEMFPSLDPCVYGWNISIMQSPYGSFPFPTTDTKSPHDSRTVALEFTGSESANCTWSTLDGSIVCVETTLPVLPSYSFTSDSPAAEPIPPTVSYIDATMTVPVNARYLTYDYRFTNIGDGDYVYLLVDDKPVWKMSGDAVVQDEWRSSGEIAIAMESGENTFVVALYGVGEQNAQFEMKNFQFIEVLPTFADVPPAHTEYGSVEALTDASVVEGCDGDGSLFCPDQTLTRETLAQWLMKALKGESYTPDPATGTLFTDVSTTSPFADWIEAFANEGITEGCGTNLYCPNAPVDKAQLAKLLLMTINGTSYTPDLATGELFDDVGVLDFNADWIEDAVNKGLLEGCGYRQFCPDEILSRSAMARILENAF